MRPSKLPLLLACGCLAAAAARAPPADPPARRQLIAHGAAAPPGRYPYMCALGMAGRGDDTIGAHQACGGTLVHPQVVLTGAAAGGRQLQQQQQQQLPAWP